MKDGRGVRKDVIPYTLYTIIHPILVCRVMDELKSTPAQSIKNRVDMAIGTSRRLQHCDGFNMTVCGADVRPVDCVRDLGVLINSNMTLSNHVNIMWLASAFISFASYVSSDCP